MSQELKIVELQVENFKRISVATIKPDGSTVVIGGNNAQGKSSAIDAIFAALKGKNAVPADPIHDGAEEGKVVLDLGEYTVERTFKENGKSTLKVKSAEGATFNSPQEMLNKFTANLGFDPHEFNRLKPADQCQAIASITGIDFDDFAKRRKKIFEERTNVNRHLKEVQAQYEGMKSDIDPDLPDEKIVLSEVLEEIDKANDHNNAGDQLFIEKKEIHRMMGEIEIRKKEAEDKIKKLNEEIQELINKQISHNKSLEENARKIEEWKPVDVVVLKEKLSTAETVNSRIDRQQEIATCKSRLDRGKEMADDLTEKIKQIDIEKENAIAAAKMPVPGLDIQDGVVLLNGHPFDQASSAEQINACVLIGLAMNPKLRVLIIRDGSLLDESNLSLIARLAEENNAQVWIERVGSGEEVGFVMEDGQLKA